MSEHFTYEELTRSATASRLGIRNTPGKEERENLEALCRNFLEPLRRLYGKPIIITSGYRCKELNKAVGGSATSQHMKGEAVDFRPESYSDFTSLYEMARRFCTYDQLLLEFNKGTNTIRCIHASCRRLVRENRMQARDFIML